MGMKLFDASGTFNPADYGLKVGDTLNIIAVGGGRGGGYNGGAVGGNGAASSFGSIVSAPGATATVGQFIKSAAEQTGGCGGYVPGASDWGGLPTGTTGSAPPGSAGRNNNSYLANKQEGLSYGGGNVFGAACGGGGYGAGGAGSTGAGNFGGNSGVVKLATHKLTSIASVAVSVGGGGGAAGTTGSGNAGSTTAGGLFGGGNNGGTGGYGGVAGGTSNYGGGGAGGCVIVFW